MNYDKLHKRIQTMLEYESDDYFININLKKDVSDKLYDYQFVHVLNLITALRFNNIILDGSDTGTGKTYCALALCKQLNLKPLIICPKTIMSVWLDVCKYFLVEPLAVVNYETIKNGKQYKKADATNNARSICKFLEVSNNNNSTSTNKFKWDLPKNSIIIFDEVHRCKNSKSENAKLLMSIKQIHKVKALMLSATVADKPQGFSVFGFMLGFYSSLRKASGWIKGMLRDDKNYIGSAPAISAISKQIYPNRGARMSIKELGNKFPQNQVSAHCYNIDNKSKEVINKSFEKIAQLELADQDLVNDNILRDLQLQRMNIELVKLPLLQELISDYLEENLSVAVFVNFKETLHQLAKKFDTDCIIYGDQDLKTRLDNIAKFQENRSTLILCTVQSGGSGISLHDKYGRQRVSIISPGWSSLDFKQVLGRICRAGAKSSAIQRVVYCAGTCEENVCDKLIKKLKFMNKLKDEELDINDADLTL